MMRRMKWLLILVVVSHTPALMTAQNHATTIKVQAMDMGTAWVNNDFNSFVKYMHPEVIAFAGGKEAMKTKMDSARTMMRKMSIRVKRYLVGQPGEIVEFKNQLQAILPQTTTLSLSLGDMNVETTMIAFSTDKGKHWWFIDTNVYAADKIKGIELSPRLIIPPRKKPTIEPAKPD